MKRKYKFILLALIIVIAAFLRLYKISSDPPSLNWDEVSHGYNAYSILKSGKDEWGKTLPLLFQAYGDYKLPVYIYLTVVPVTFFGLNEFSVRIISVIAGIVSVIATYFLVNELFRGKKMSFEINNVAFLSALLVAIEPWSLFLSRAAFEANLALSFFILGTLLFFKSLKKNYYIIYSALFYGLSVWTYNSYRIFTPIVLFVLIFLYRRELSNLLKTKRNILLVTLTISAFFFIPMFYQLIKPVGLARYDKVGIIDSGAINQIIEHRANSDLPTLIKRLIYNRPVYFVTSFIKNWLSHYTSDFLFINGGSNYQFNIPGFGLIYLVNGIFILIATFYFLLKRSRSGLFILTMFYIGSVSSALTREAPHTLRAITMLPSPMILSAFGFFIFKSKLRKAKTLDKIVVILYLIIISVFAGRFLNNYFTKYPVTYSESWQYGYKQIADYIGKNYNNYDRIIITKKYGEPHEFILFYLNWNPINYNNDPNLKRFYQSGWFWVDSFDKFFFVNDWDIPKEEWEDFKLESGKKFSCLPAPNNEETPSDQNIQPTIGNPADKTIRCLLVTSPDNYPKGWTKLETVNFLDKRTAFEILRNFN